MTERGPHDVSFELGGIKSSLDTITRTLSEDRQASATYRTDIRRELANRGDGIAAVAAEVGLIKRDVADMKPKVESLDQRAMMSKGAANLAIVLGKFAHVISAALGAGIVFLLEYWLGGRR